MPTDAERLLNLAAAVADGRGLNWVDAESSTTDDGERALVRQLRLLADVAEANRQIDEETASWPIHAPIVEAPWQWGALEIRRELGSGGFGKVYRAWDPGLARDVAVKLLPVERPGSEAQILREGRLLARVRHPHVITVYGADAIGDRVGISMELIEGRTLEALLRQHGPMSAREAATIGIDLCGALAAVHAANLLHRDVKAQNVMREDGGRIVLMDFGAGQESLLSDVSLRAIGTPAYMAPELFDGGPPSRQSDIYSLGVLLFRLVTCAYPVAGGDIDAVKQAHAAGNRRGVVDLRPDLPARFVQVIERALRPTPADRFSTAGEMQQYLLRSLEVPSGKTATRRATIALISLGGVAAAAALIWPPSRRTLRGWIGLDKVTNIAVLPFSQVAPDAQAAYFSNGITEILMSRLMLIPSLRVMARSSVDALPPDGRNANGAWQRMGTPFVVEGSVEQRDGRVRVVARLIEAKTATVIWTDVFERPLGDLFTLQGEIATAIGSEIGASLTGDTRSRLLSRQTTSTEAQDAYLQARYLIYTFNRARFDEARRLLERAVVLDPAFALAHASLARTYGLMLDGDMAPARELIPLAAAAAAKALNTGSDVPEANVAYADAQFRYEHNWDAADAAYRRALELSPNSSLVRSPYARFLCAADRLSEAVAEAEAGSLADPISAEMTATVGITHYYRREFDQALRYYERAAQLSPGYGPVYFGMARVHSAQQNYSLAIEHIQKAITLVGDNPTYQAELARNYALGGWRNSAEQVLGGLIRSAAAGTSGVNFEGIGYAYAALGDIDRAFEWLDRSLEQYFGRLLFIKVDPRADPLRKDPRFTTLLARLGLN